ncbi:MAG: replication initiation protein [Terrimicrobiaceae bacterium]
MEEQMDKQLVVKSNFLIEASYRLSAIEQKIILTLATKIKKTDRGFQKYFFNLGELGDFLGLKTNSDYAYLREVTKNLLSRVLTLKKEESTLQTHWLEAVEYFDSRGAVALNFNPELKPFLLQLKSNFTKYQLKYAILLKSLFSIRVYELLKQYEKIGYRDFLLEELRQRVGIKKDEYPLYGNFKAKVILVAQKELEAKTDISFKFEEIKVGRGVGKIRFYIKSNETGKAQLDEPLAIQTVVPMSQEIEEIKKLLALLPQDYQKKESLRKLLKTWLEKQGFDYVVRNIEYANDGSNAVNPGASRRRGSNYRVYLAKALAGDFGLPYKEDKEVKQKAEAEAKQKTREAVNAKKQRDEQAQKEKEDIEKARIYQKSLSPEELANLREEAISQMTPQHQEMVKKKAIGSEMMLKIIMVKVSTERMKRL